MLTIAAILGGLAGYLFASYYFTNQLDKVRAIASKYQNIVLFHEIVEKVRLVCAFRVKQIDKSDRSEQIITWHPDIFIGTSDFLKPVKTVTILQRTFANDVEKVCDLSVNLEGELCQITMQTPNNRPEQFFEIDKNGDSPLWSKLRDMIQPPVAVICDSYADEMFRKMREKKDDEN